MILAKLICIFYAAAGGSARRAVFQHGQQGTYHVRPSISVSSHSSLLHSAENLDVKRSESHARFADEVFLARDLASLLLAVNPSVVNSPSRIRALQSHTNLANSKFSGMRSQRYRDAKMFAVPEAIDLGVKVATFAPQYLWLLMILAPNWDFTRKVMLPFEPIAVIALVHFAIVVLATSVDQGTAPIMIFADVFDPSQSQLDGMERLFAYRNFVAEEWPHVLIWDLFVGRFIWLDGLRRGIFTPHSVLLTNLIGPPGLLLHFLTCAITGKGIPKEEAPDLPEN
mmetsp:Transcript_10870/g.17956  ORF Transcript_10870/g.17956 Transcript_10870/m.17956 type:complete len:283 (-) Transcript_10870:195-1043(-)